MIGERGGLEKNGLSNIQRLTEKINGNKSIQLPEQTETLKEEEENNEYMQEEMENDMMEKCLIGRKKKAVMHGEQFQE
ncbi:MAG: hypothetical protein Ta2E_13380 [Mycoplasmoidaceae bacterium]|nr:MAG: hypothetical protein Ta2E_13380 [Mycoplasmoidaceae bacterium]